MSTGEILICQNQEGNIKIDVRLEEETFWLTLLYQIAELFSRDKSVISRYLSNIYKQGELQIEATVAKFATVQKRREINVQSIL